MKRAVPLKTPSQCEDAVHDKTMLLNRSKRQDSPRCTGRARYAIDGKKLCRRHASMLALSILLAGCTNMDAYWDCYGRAGGEPLGTMLGPAMMADPGVQSWQQHLEACVAEKLASAPR